MTIEARLWQVESRLALRELVARYALAIDDKDVPALRDLFTRQACFSFGSGLEAPVRGRDAVISLYAERLALMRQTCHAVHDQVVTFTDGASRHATAIVTAHAEMWRNEQVEVAAIRYHDSYAVEDGAWKIAARNVRFFYYLPVGDYPSAFGTPLRLRAGAVPQPADYPEKLASWSAYWSAREHGDAPGQPHEPD